MLFGIFIIMKLAVTRFLSSSDKLFYIVMLLNKVRRSEKKKEKQKIQTK